MMRVKEESYHTPVLLKDCIDALQIRPEGIYVDVTFGGGGHSREIFKRLVSGKLIAFDVDPDAGMNAIDDKRFILILKNFTTLKNALAEKGITVIDGLLADLGVSSYQFDTAERGFSTRFDAPLDMRMDKDSGITAGEIIRTYSEENLRKIFRTYGEIREASRMAKKIVENKNQIRTVSDLKNTLAELTRKGKENQFYAKVFQALRIEVNNELNSLKELLLQSISMLKLGGRIAVISYHSLEDRLVKNFFRSGNFTGELEKDIYGNVNSPLKTINKKPIVPEQKEIAQNSRARSAKLRIAERII